MKSVNIFRDFLREGTDMLKKLRGALILLAFALPAQAAEQSVHYVSHAAFPAGNAQLLPEARSELLALLRELEIYPAVLGIEVTGHADASGPAAFNEWLAELRAERVAKFLLQQGVDPRRLSFKGAGSRKPLPGTDDPAMQRRFEIHLRLAAE